MAEYLDEDGTAENVSLRLKLAPPENIYRTVYYEKETYDLRDGCA